MTEEPAKSDQAESSGEPEAGMPASDEAAPARRRRREDPPEKESTRRRRASLGHKLLKLIVPPLFFLFSYLVFGTCRQKRINPEHFDDLVLPGKSIIYACYHQGIIYLPFLLRHRAYGARHGMVSQHTGADFIAETMRMFGQRAARGSSTRGGRAALQVMIDTIVEGLAEGSEAHHGLLTVDGPKGPAREAKMGIIKLARETGLPIVPANWYARPAFRFGNWDRTMIPFPFGRITIAYGAPIHVPRELSDDEAEALRRQVEVSLWECFVAAAGPAAEGETPPPAVTAPA